MTACPFCQSPFVAREKYNYGTGQWFTIFECKSVVWDNPEITSERKPPTP